VTLTCKEGRKKEEKEQGREILYSETLVSPVLVSELRGKKERKNSSFGVFAKGKAQQKREAICRNRTSIQGSAAADRGLKKEVQH